jgi:hypothetical protein
VHDAIDRSQPDLRRCDRVPAPFQDELGHGGNAVSDQREKLIAPRWVASAEDRINLSRAFGARVYQRAHSVASDVPAQHRRESHSALGRHTVER